MSSLLLKRNYTSRRAKGKDGYSGESRTASLQKTLGHSRIERPNAEVGYNQQLLRLRLSVRVAPLGRCAVLLLLGRAVLLLWGGVLLLGRAVLRR
jgi:hypothetical protein